tara:strand:+ start:4614 stop:6473 length:1860 start_codon:yes stop_codon:yes gene_type:complete
MANKINRDIKYLNRDFSDIRAKLVEFSKTYYPNTYNDFSPTSPGMMFMEQAAYVGDVMSFYLDNQITETYTQFAKQTNNLYELAYMFGYKPKISNASQVEVELYQQIPAILSVGEYIPDYNYSLVIEGNTTLSTTINPTQNFIVQDKCDFSINTNLDPTEISVYEVLGNNPVSFLLKKTRKAVSATISTQTVSFGNFTPFPTINIESDNILKILDITDENGKVWKEVDYLGQEMVFNSIKNTNVNDPNNVADVGEVPYLLQLKKCQRRFATRFTSATILQIQFGSGNPADTDELITPNPNNVGIGLPFKQDKLTTAYSPTNFLFTNTYGIAPTNTTLTIRYLTGGGVESNIASGVLTNIDTSNTKFSNSTLNDITANTIFASIAVTNPEAADGGNSGDTDEEIRQKTVMQISAQQRTVTLDDYMIRAMSMPPDFGTVSKIYIEKPTLDQQISTIETLCMYILSLNSEGQLSTPTNTLKKNLRTYLSQYKMIGDSIEIKDAYIINISVDFEIIVLPNFINSQIILSCIEALQSYFNIDNWQLNQPIILKDLFILLDQIEGVQTVKNISIANKKGTTIGYSEYSYDIPAALLDGVIYPSLDASIFEIKYPNTDIKGRVVPL